MGRSVFALFLLVVRFSGTSAARVNVHLTSELAQSLIDKLDKAIASDEESQHSTTGKCCLYTGSKKFEWKSGACYASHVDSGFGQQTCKQLGSMDVCSELKSSSAEECYATILSMQKTDEDVEEDAPASKCYTCKRKGMTGVRGSCAKGGSGTYTSRPDCSKYRATYSGCVAVSKACPAFVEVGAGESLASTLDEAIAADEVAAKDSEHSATGKCCLYTGSRKFEWKSGACYASHVDSGFGQQTCKQLGSMDVCSELKSSSAEECYATILSMQKSDEDVEEDSPASKCYTCKRKGMTGVRGRCAKGGSGTYTGNPDCSKYRATYSGCVAVSTSCA